MTMPVLFLKANHPARPVRPTEAQKEAGNYAMERMTFQGLPITIENPRGSIRSGRDRGGNEWSVSMAHHYGYIRGTVGSDGDHYDVYVGPNAEAEHAYIVTTMAPPDFTAEDEQKAMLGFNSEEEARAAYLVHYDNQAFFGRMQTMPMAEFKAKVLATAEGDGLVKALVHAHERRGPGGRVIFVKPYNTRAPAAVEGQPDLFGDAIFAGDIARRGPGGAGGADHGLPGAPGHPAQPADHWAALAERGAIGAEAADALRKRAVDGRWPDGFCSGLADAIDRLPPSMRRWITQNPQAFVIAYRHSIDEIPPAFRAIYRSAAGICVNHNRIEFLAGQMAPTLETLRHEMVHLAWYRMVGRWGHKGGPAGAVIEEALDHDRAAGAAMIKAALSKKMGRDAPAPKGVDSFDWAMIRSQADRVRRDLRRTKKFIGKGYRAGDILRKSLELSIALADDNLVKLANSAGVRFHGQTDDAPWDGDSATRAEIALARGYADHFGADLDGEYAVEEPVAYRAGHDADYADRLFSTIAPEGTEMRKGVILFLKAAIRGGAMGDLFGEKVTVEGHTRGGTYVAPYQAVRHKAPDVAPEHAEIANTIGAWHSTRMRVPQGERHADRLEAWRKKNHPRMVLSDEQRQKIVEAMDARRARLDARVRALAEREKATPQAPAAPRQNRRDEGDFAGGLPPAVDPATIAAKRPRVTKQVRLTVRDGQHMTDIARQVFDHAAARRKAYGKNPPSQSYAGMLAVWADESGVTLSHDDEGAILHRMGALARGELADAPKDAGPGMAGAKQQDGLAPHVPQPDKAASKPDFHGIRAANQAADEVERWMADHPESFGMASGKIIDAALGEGAIDEAMRSAVTREMTRRTAARGDQARADRERRRDEESHARGSAAMKKVVLMPKPAAPTPDAGTEPEDLAEMRAHVERMKGRSGTASEERAAKVYAERLAADPAKWKAGMGVKRGVMANGGMAQWNRGFRIVKVDPASKKAMIRQVADTGLTSTGGDGDRIGDEWVYLGDLRRDKAHDSDADSAANLVAKEYAARRAVEQASRYRYPAGTPEAKNLEKLQAKHQAAKAALDALPAGTQPKSPMIIGWRG